MPPSNPGKSAPKKRDLRNTEDDWPFEHDNSAHSPKPRTASARRNVPMEAERIQGVEKTMAVAMEKLEQVLHRIERLDAATQASSNVDENGNPSSRPFSGGAVSQTGVHMPKPLAPPAPPAAGDTATRTARKSHASDGGTDAGGGGDDFDGFDGNGEEESASENVEEDIRALVKVESDEWMINPTKKFRMTWDLALIMPFLIYLAVVMPFRLCFANEAVVDSGIYWFEFIIDLLFIADIVFNFRTGIFVGRGGADSNDEGGGGGELVEYDRWEVAKAYLFSWFLLDIVSGIPFALIDRIMGSGGSGGALKAMKSLKLLRFLKLGRLFKLEKILSNLDRDTLDKLEDFMQAGGTRSAIVMSKLLIGLAYACHLLACGFVLVGRYGYTTYGCCGETWLDADNLGPFKARDTSGIDGGKLVMTIYIAAFYFSLTTMTSVGYGDIITHNNAERIFTVCLQFIGAIIFAMVIAQITAVVSTMDTNARKTAEQLDAVTSFVEMRQFPEALGRRIRRHFRHFYSLKSAIDEAKIFSELSTTLRREVSAYLVSELMGEESFFSTMPPNLWPRILPLLCPTRFEQTELVAMQGEECSELYVVLSGQVTGEIVVTGEFMPRVRRITAGNSINVLAALGCWTKCVETAVCDTEVEAYAVVCSDFRALFTAENDVLEFEKMQRYECRNFKMDTSCLDAPYGQPQYYICFATLEFTLVQAKGLLNVDRLAKARQRSKGTSETEGASWLVADLVDKVSGKPFQNGTMWRHQTARAPLKPAAGAPDAAHGGVDMADEPYWGETVLWGDLNQPFDKVALRVRLYFTDNASERLLGKVLIPLDAAHELSQKQPSRHGSSTMLSGAGRDRKLAILEEGTALSHEPSGGGPRSSSLLPLQAGEVEAWYKLRSPEAGTLSTTTSALSPDDAAASQHAVKTARSSSIEMAARMPSEEKATSGSDAGKGAGASAVGDEGGNNSALALEAGESSNGWGSVQIRMRAVPAEYTPKERRSSLKREVSRISRSSNDLEHKLQLHKRDPSPDGDKTKISPKSKSSSSSPKASGKKI